MSHRVAVIGGGYGGAAVAKALESEADVILIDPRDAFVNAAGSLRALTQPGRAGNMLRLGTELTALPATQAGRIGTFTVTTSGGDAITADIWFVAYGVHTNSDYSPNSSAPPSPESISFA